MALITQRYVTRRPAATLRVGWRLGRHDLAIAIVLSLVAALAFFRRTDPDFWWHWRAGRDILATGVLPRVDSYSHTAAGWPWVAHEWLWEVITAAIMAATGYVGLSLLLAVLLVLTFGLLYRLLRAQGVQEWVAAALVALAVLMSMRSLTARPHAVTFLFVVITLWLLEWRRRGHERALWWLVPLLPIWANIHGGYAIGLGIVGVVLAGEVVEAWRAHQRPRVGTLVGVLGAGLVAASLNPQGPAIHLFALGFMNRESAMQRYIQEWASPNFHDWPSMAFALALLLTMLVGLRPARLGWGGVLLPLAFAWLGVQALRHIPLFALAGLPALAAGLSDYPTLRARQRSPEPAPLAVINWLMVLAIGGAIAVLVAQQPLAQVHRAPQEEWYPVGAVAFLREARPPGPIFNYDGWGGYLISEAPEYPVFADGRADLYGVGVLEEYRQVMALEPGWQDVLARRGIRLVLLQQGEPLAEALQHVPGWAVLYQDAEAVVLGQATAR